MICKHRSAAVCPTKKGIFSVYYIAFLEDNRHFTINYNKNKEQKNRKENVFIYSYIIIHGFMASNIL